MCVNRLELEWKYLKDKDITKDGFSVKRISSRPDCYLEAWKVYFVAPDYSDLDLFSATIYFPVNYPFDHPILYFDKFKFYLYEFEDVGPAESLENSFKWLISQFYIDEYFYRSNGPNSEELFVDKFWRYR